MKELSAITKCCVWIWSALIILAVSGCSSSPARYSPPAGPGPQTVFIAERDYQTTWNALMRALEQTTDAEIWYKANEEGKVTLRDAEVPVFRNCLCGTVGDAPLRGLVLRSVTIDLGREAPQLTRIRIQCSYKLPFSWPNVYGRSSMQQDIECISTGRFEQELFDRTARFLYPQ
ncbi:hypothetical protein SAMN02745216_00934 [Desulfatibacillum alkenivorans DSM 16219]|uniref:Uncharacterized protein n=1 Tax=Desulfatibacillum alkenivorans DSM 16219 TaxID=1121393 RepID=A0A1M6FWT1_9BACT|nr:hypothetical protein SAMN02745216_00934 [Desulfatibacillum alkenivorans DSM 16219]